MTTIYTVGKGQSAANNAKVSHAITGNIIDPGLLNNTASRISVCRGTHVQITTWDSGGGAINTPASNGISCNSSGCNVTEIQSTEKYISRSADGKDTDRITILAK